MFALFPRSQAQFVPASASTPPSQTHWEISIPALLPRRPPHHPPSSSTSGQVSERSDLVNAPPCTGSIYRTPALSTLCAIKRHALAQRRLMGRNITESFRDRDIRRAAENPVYHIEVHLQDSNTTCSISSLFCKLKIPRCTDRRVRHRTHIPHIGNPWASSGTKMVRFWLTWCFWILYSCLKMKSKIPQIIRALPSSVTFFLIKRVYWWTWGSRCKF